MPEGDTIRRLADSLTAKFAGSTVVSSRFRHPRLATVDLSGSRLLEADARGKHLLMRFTPDWTLHVHLRMTGSVVRRFAREVRPNRRKFEIRFDNGWTTGVDIPILELMRTRDERHAIDFLGPDVCGAYDHAEALRRLSRVGPIPISQALLDQQVVAGFGNIYAVETPFLVGVHPYAPTDQLAPLSGLLAVAVGLIRTNARFGPQNTTGRGLHATNHWVLSRTIYRCQICGRELVRQTGAETPWQRRTAWCETCQPRESDHVDLARAARLLRLHPCRQIVNLTAGELLVDVRQPVRTERSGFPAGRRKTSGS